MFNPGAPPPPAYSNEWQCYRCTLLNAQSANVCVACQTRKPEDENHLPPPPADEPPAFEAAVSNVQVQAGVPQNCLQVICPNCRILIALPPGMPRFLCPRCRTECMAPPMHHFHPQQPAAGGMHFQPHGSAPPPQMNMDRPNANNNRPMQFVPHTPLPGSVSPGGNAGSRSPGGGYQPVGSPSRDVKDNNAGAASARGGVSSVNANNVQNLNETRLDGMNWPRGTWHLSVRGFFLAQCPLLNFYWFYFLTCSNRPVSSKNRYQYEWYDTNAAKCGFTLGFTLFLGWLILYIAVGAKNHLSGYGVLGSLLAVFFGPLILVVLCWECTAWNRCGTDGAVGVLKDPCPGCTFDCACGDCACCDNCCSCCDNCCRDCKRCCGNCDCGGCDCGGCDC